MSAIANPSPGFARNPDKIINIEGYEGMVTVEVGGTVIASTKRAKELAEPPYPPVIYIPFDDIDFSKLLKTSHSSHCPYKGDASYWSVLAAGEEGENAMWGYENPYDEMMAIKNHAAFYTDRVTLRTA